MGKSCVLFFFETQCMYHVREVYTVEINYYTFKDGFKRD